MPDSTPHQMPGGRKGAGVGCAVGGKGAEVGALGGAGAVVAVAGSRCTTVMVAPHPASTLVKTSRPRIGSLQCTRMQYTLPAWAAPFAHRLPAAV